MTLTEPPVQFDSLDGNDTVMTSNFENSDAGNNVPNIDEGNTSSNKKSENLFLDTFLQNLSISSNSQIVSEEEVTNSEGVDESHKSSEFFKATIPSDALSTHTPSFINSADGTNLGQHSLDTITGLIQNNFFDIEYGAANRGLNHKVNLKEN